MIVMFILFFLILLIVIWIILTSKHSSTFQNVDNADIVIVGAGTAGCILANRLHSKYPQKKIIILERGTDQHNNPIIYNIKNGPIAAYQQPYSEVLSTDFPGVDASVAKLYGGASSHNYGLVVHGSPQFYNGLLGLSYDQYLKYFKRVENYSGKTENRTLRGTSGKLQVSQLPTQLNIGSKIFPLLGKAVTNGPNLIFKSINVALNTGPLRASNKFSNKLIEIISRTKSVPIVEDYNTDIISCVSSTPQLFVDPVTGLRSSVDVTYLPPNDKTLRLIGGSTVSKISESEIEWIDHQGKSCVTQVNDKIILCAGGIYTPRILRKSGYMNVGNNLITHYGTTVIFSIIADESDNLNFSSGPLAFVPRTSGNTRDWQIISGGSTLLNKNLLKNIGIDADAEQMRNPNIRYITFLLWNLKPRTRGSVIDSIQLRLFEDGGLEDSNSDLSSIIAGAQWMYEIVDELKKDYPTATLIYPPPKSFSNINNLVKYVKDGVTVTDHYSGTCALGTLVNPNNFLLKGTRNIHVVDASIFSKISDGNTEFPVAVIAEVAADCIM